MGQAGSTPEEIQRRRQEFLRDHPWAAGLGLAWQGYQIQHPEVQEALAPLDDAVTGIRDTIGGGVDAVKFLVQNRMLIGAGIVLYLVLSLRR